MEPTPIAKMVPPARPAGCLDRPLLAQRITPAMARRLTTVIAEAGYGKSTLLTSWWGQVPCAWYTADAGDHDLSALARQLSDTLRLRVPDLPAELARVIEGASGTEEEQPSRADALGARLGQVLHQHLAADLLLVIDDIDELGSGSPSARLVEALCRHAPPRLHLVLSGRRRPPFPVERLRGQGQLLEISGEQLAFTAAEVAQLVEERLGSDAGAIAADVHRLAGGWPAAVILAIEALRESPAETWPRMVAGLDRPPAPLFAYLAEEVFAHHPATFRQLISRVAILEQFTPELCEALGMADAREIIEELSQRSLFVEARQDGWYALRPLIREFALEHLPVPEALASELRVAAAGSLAGSGHTAMAIRTLLSARATGPLAALVTETGPALLQAGQVRGVLDACRAIPSPLRTARIEQLEGQARQIQGDWSGALACFERAAAGSDQLPAELAWRMGLLHYLRGKPDAALEVYRRGLGDATAEPVEMGLLLAWTATAHWLRGEVDSCRKLAARALGTAQSCADPRALAAAHTVMALIAALDGDRRANDAHYLLALRAAEEAGDALQTVRIRTNRASHFLEEGSYGEALQELEVAVALAELTSFASFQALSLCNRGETRLRMGRLDEALADLEMSRARYEQIASDMVAYPLSLIGDIYRERGNLAQARACYEEATAIAEASGDQQALVPALTGLATVLAGEEPERAGLLAQRAVAGGTGLGYVSALLAEGWITAMKGDREEARDRATQAGSVARTRRDRAGLAEALALRAMSADVPRRELRRLDEAAAIWREIGNPLEEAKVELAMAAVEGAAESTLRRRRAERWLEALGVHAHRGGNVAAGLLALVGRGDAAAIRIESLGGFAVLRGGELVKLSEWQSKRARELLKLLVARRGRPASRGYLMETLWPDEEPGRVANRLSVALTTIRTVLGVQRQASGDLILADRDSVALNVDAVDIDLERLLASSADGLARLRSGDTDAALTLLESAAAAYAGDFLEENPYDDWAVPAREEARAAYIAVAQALAGLASRSAEPERAVPHLLRILEIDRFDEPAHLGLVAALSQSGRHGEAHRHYLNYRRAMDELGVEPSAFPGGPGSPGEVPQADRPAFTQP